MRRVCGVIWFFYGSFGREGPEVMELFRRLFSKKALALLASCLREKFLHAAMVFVSP
jgi:hypothetical protein